MGEAVAIVPARIGSRGIKNKNFRDLVGRAPFHRAVRCALDAGIEQIVISTDHPTLKGIIQSEGPSATALYAPAPLHTDTCAMIDVVKDVLARVPGEPDQKIVLLQPTQPLRTPAHIQRALELLTPEVDSVVSVVELPQTHAAVNHAHLADDGLFLIQPWTTFTPTRRQDCGRSFIRDGTAYCFWRRTVEQHGNIYGENVRPLILDASETCALDSESDWRDAERRLRDRTP